MQAAEQERIRIAAELHDGPIQRLSVLTYDLERAKEAPLNVARHARAKRLWLELEGVGDRVQLCIRDDGIGFDPTSGSDLVRTGHFGPGAMRERVELAGGRFQLESRPGAGVVVRAPSRSPPRSSFRLPGQG